MLRARALSSKPVSYWPRICFVFLEIGLANLSVSTVGRYTTAIIYQATFGSALSTRPVPPSDKLFSQAKHSIEGARGLGPGANPTTLTFTSALFTPASVDATISQYAMRSIESLKLARGRLSPTAGQTMPLSHGS